MNLSESEIDCAENCSERSYFLKWLLGESEKWLEPFSSYPSGITDA